MAGGPKTVTAVLVVTTFLCSDWTLGTQVNACSQLCSAHGQHVPGSADTSGNLSPTISHWTYFKFLIVEANCKLEKRPKLTMSQEDSSQLGAESAKHTPQYQHLWNSCSAVKGQTDTQCGMERSTQHPTLSWDWDLEQTHCPACAS